MKQELKEKVDRAIDHIGAVLMELRELRKAIMNEPIENLDENMKASRVMQAPIRYAQAIKRVQYEFDCGSNRAKELFKEWCYKGWVIKVGKKRHPQSFYQWNDHLVKKEDHPQEPPELDLFL